MFPLAAVESTFITVTVGNTRGKNKSPGDFDPHIAILVAEYLSQRARGEAREDRSRIDRVARNFVVRSQKMHAGGKTTPFWSSVSASEEDMSYECDAALKAPREVDCAQLEWGALGADDETFSVGPAATKILSSSTLFRPLNTLYHCT